MLRRYFCAALILSTSVFAQALRPIRDHVGFGWDAGDMTKVINYLERNSGLPEFPPENMIAAISPHDDYLYAGEVYFPVFKLIAADEIVIFGLTHGSVRKEIGDPKDIIILDDYEFWPGPFLNVGISPLREKIKTSLDDKYFTVNRKAHELEHSIEALIPFLQYYNRDIKITPIMVTAMSFDKAVEIGGRLSEIIINYMKERNYTAGKDIFFLISNDANHYGEDFDNSWFGLDINAHVEATKNDKRIISERLCRTIDNESLKELTSEIWKNDDPAEYIPLWCGRYPMVLGLMTVKNISDSLYGNKVQGKLFKYSDTFSTGVLPIKGTSLGITAPFSLKHWVGFFSAGFYLE